MPKEEENKNEKTFLLSKLNKYSAQREVNNTVDWYLCMMMALHTERGKKSEIQMRFIKSTRDLYTRCDAGRQKQFFFQGKYFIQSFPLMSQSTFETGDLFELKYYLKIFERHFQNFLFQYLFQEATFPTNNFGSTIY